MFFLGKRDRARSHNQVVIVHCLVELFCILHPRMQNYLGKCQEEANGKEPLIRVFF